MTNHIVELLARFEFAGCAVLHIVFPTISIGLATFLTVLEGCYLKTKKQIYRDLSDYWRKIFAITFEVFNFFHVIISRIIIKFSQLDRQSIMIEHTSSIYYLKFAF